MNTPYYEITGEINGSTEVLFGSFDKSDLDDELRAERENWKEQGYTNIHKASRMVDETPDPEVYGDGVEHKIVVCKALAQTDVTVSVGDSSVAVFDVEDSRDIGDIFEAVEATEAPVVSFFKAGEHAGTMSVDISGGNDTIVDYTDNAFMNELIASGV